MSGEEEKDFKKILKFEFGKHVIISAVTVIAILWTFKATMEVEMRYVKRDLKEVKKEVKEINNLIKRKNYVSNK